MNQINTFFTQAELALAAYGNFHIGERPDLAELIDKGMTTSEADRFAAQWFVVDQYNAINGLSATVFQNQSGKRYLTVRGTDPSLLDLTADFILTNGFPPQLNPQFQSLKAKIQEWTSNGVLPSTFTVAGHSLGGYLASAVGLEFGARIEAVYTYNAPGVDGALNGVVNMLRVTLGITGAGTLNTLQNLRATSGFSLIANLGNQLALPTLIETEFSLNPLDNHSIVPLSDALGVYAAYSELAPALTTEQIGQIIRASSNQNKLSLESALDALRLMLLGNVSSTAEGDREALYGNLNALQESAAYSSLAGQATLRVLAGTDQDALSRGAKNDFGDFLALEKLLPVAIEGATGVLSQAHPALYATWSEDQAKRSAGNTRLEYTDAWLSDRADLLDKLITYNNADGNVTLRTNALESELLQSLGPDGQPQVTLTVVGRLAAGGNGAAAANPVKIVFGGEGADTIDGGETFKGDRLYGGAGNDELKGNGGSDYLEGGKDYDTYVYNTSDGFDTILDTDDRGKIVFDGIELTGGIRVSENTYFSPDKEFSYSFTGNLNQGGTLVINGDIRILDFKNNDLGIFLNDTSAFSETQPFSRAYVGTYSYGTGGAEVFGSDGNDHFISIGYQDVSVFNGKAGDDLIETSSSSIWSIYRGAAGNDVFVPGSLRVEPEFHIEHAIEGGPGADIIFGSHWDDTIYADYVTFFSNAAIGNDFFRIDNFEYSHGQGSYIGRWGELESLYEDENRFFSGGFPEALNYVLGIAPSTDVASIYDDFVDGGDGNDLIEGGMGADTLLGGEGDDDILGDTIPQIRFLDGVNPADFISLFGIPGDDYLDGGNGNDQLSDVHGGNDVLIGGDGNDGIGNFDPLTGATSFFNYLDGSSGNDNLASRNQSLNGFDTLLGGPGNDTLALSFGAGYLDGGPDADYLRGSIGDDVLDGGTGGDLLIGGAGNDLYTVDRPTLLIPDYLSGSAKTIVRNVGLLLEDDPNFHLSVFDEFGDIVAEDPNEGTDTVESVITYTLPANVENLTLTGEAAIDGTGNALDNVLTGNSAANVLDGGAGDDDLFGGTGNDTYRFGLGSGKDFIEDFDSASGNVDSILMGPGILPDSLIVSREDDNLVIGINGAADQLSIRWFSHSAYKIERVAFSDGTLWDAGMLENRLFGLSVPAQSDPGVGNQNNPPGYAGTPQVGNVGDSLEAGSGTASGESQESGLSEIGGSQTVRVLTELADLDRLQSNAVKTAQSGTVGEIAEAPSILDSGENPPLTVGAQSDQAQNRSDALFFNEPNFLELLDQAIREFDQASVTPSENPDPEEIARHNQIMHAWLDQHPHDGDEGEDLGLPPVNFFNIHSSLTNSTSAFQSFTGLPQATLGGIAGIGGHSMQPLAGLNEGFARLG